MTSQGVLNDTLLIYYYWLGSIMYTSFLVVFNYTVSYYWLDNVTFT